MLLYGSAVISNALMYAGITTASGVYVFSKLPQSVKEVIIKNGFFADVLAAGATFMILGKTLTSLLAATLVGCITSFLVWAAKPFILNNENELVVELEIV